MTGWRRPGTKMGSAKRVEGRMAIDTDAPVIASASLDVAAPPERVWEIMTSFPDWPSWNPDVRWVEIEGDVAPGTGFSWNAGPGVIRSHLTRVEPPWHLEWTGKTMGIAAVHAWRLQPTGEGTTVVTEESWDGFLPRLFRSSTRRTLDRSIRSGLSALKAAAEQDPSG